ncbi:MAG: glycosyltransferase family 2 protein, partial [Fidelibacterota bacterium]
MMTDRNAIQIAVLLPCYNEEPTIAKVVSDFKNALPDAAIYVFDNNSTDQSASLAREAGATVVHSPQPGKGNVVRHMFAVIDADLYLMVDADDTYPPDKAAELIAAQNESGADMVVGMRLSEHDTRAFRSMHKFGNRL